MVHAFQEVHKTHESYNVSMRTAAFLVGIQRVNHVATWRGLYA